MKRDPHTLHNDYLNELVNRLDEIDEKKQQVEWILKDGLWLKKNSYSQYKLADLVLAYYDGSAVPVELKGNSSKRDKAKEQLKSTYWFITKVLGLKCYYGKFVTYAKGKYDSETMMFRKNSGNKW